MSPYFPTKEEQQTARAYKCRGCGGMFVRGDFTCAVMHAPGTCCHYGDTRVGSDEVVGSDGKTASERKAQK